MIGNTLKSATICIFDKRIFAKPYETISDHLGYTVCSIAVNGQQMASAESVQAELTKAKAYTLAFFIKSNASTEDEAAAQKNQMLHLQYLFGMKEAGKLLLFGPLTDESSIRGILIFSETDTTIVKQLLDQDPHVRTGHLKYEIHPWFGVPGQGLK